MHGTLGYQSHAESACMLLPEGCAEAVCVYVCVCACVCVCARAYHNGSTARSKHIQHYARSSQHLDQYRRHQTRHMPIPVLQRNTLCCEQHGCQGLVCVTHGHAEHRTVMLLCLHDDKL